MCRVLIIMKHMLMTIITKADELPELDVMFRTIVRWLYGVVWEPYFSIDFDGNIKLGLIWGKLAYFVPACALWGVLSIINNVVDFQALMPALVSAGLEKIIGDGYVRYRALELTFFELFHSFSFSLSLLFSFSIYGV